MSAPAAAMPKARLVTVVWGESYVRRLLDVAWRTLLSPGNLPALLERMAGSYVVFTDDESASVIRDSPQFSRLQLLMPVEIITFPREEMDEDRYNGHWKLWSRAIEEARLDKDIVFLIIPDMVFFDGALARWAKHIADGKRAIFTIGTWVLEETFLPAYHVRFPTQTHEFVALPPAEGMDFILRHMHPLQAASLSDSPSHLYHLDRMTECVPGQGIVSRVFSSQPLVFDPTYFKFDRNRCPIDRFADIAMEEVCGFSLGSLLHVSEYYYGQGPFENQRIRGLASWAAENVAMYHVFESRFDYIYARPDVPRDELAWQAASRKLDGTAASVLAMQAIAEVWRFAVEQKNCEWSQNLIALANWRWDLHRFLRTDRGFTVFLPLDAAFPDDFEQVYEALAAGNADSGLLSLVLDHVVPQRLWLRDHRIVIETDDAQAFDGPRTLGGRRVRTLAARDGFSRGARVLGAPERIGFGLVYRIDSLLDGHHELVERRAALSTVKEAAL